MSVTNFLKKSAFVSFAIVICRILGLVREVLLAWLFGGGALMSAWGLAFMVPNLFRRLFGEGALGASIIPVFSHSYEKDSIEESRRKLGAVFLSLTLLLFSLSFIFSLLAIFAEPFAEVKRVRLMLQLLPLIMPYAVFICLVGAMSSALNARGVFFLPAIGTLSLNIFMIICLLLVCPFIAEPENKLKILAFFVVLSGFIQLVFTLGVMKFFGIFPDLRNSQFWREPVVKELWRLTLPGIIGASALQISFIADRSMACWLGDYAVPALNYSDRIIDLPIGIFAVAMATVVAPNLARSVARGEDEVHQRTFLSSLEAMLFLSFPIAVFIFIFRVPIVRLFYMRGAFGEKELSETVWAMTFYCIGIPWFCLVKIISSAFHSRKDMKTPLKVSLFCIGLNIVLNLILMFPLRQGGIALATVVSSMCNCFSLLYILKKRNSSLQYYEFFRELIIIALAAGLAAFPSLILFSYEQRLKSYFQHLFIRDFIMLSVAFIVFCFLFICLAYIFKSKSSESVLRSAKFALEKRGLLS